MNGRRYAGIRVFSCVCFLRGCGWGWMERAVGSMFYLQHTLLQPEMEWIHGPEQHGWGVMRCEVHANSSSLLCKGECTFSLQRIWRASHELIETELQQTRSDAELSSTFVSLYIRETWISLLLLEKTWQVEHQQWHVGLNTVVFTYVLGLRLS